MLELNLNSCLDETAVTDKDTCYQKARKNNQI